MVECHFMIRRRLIWGKQRCLRYYANQYKHGCTGMKTVTVKQRIDRLCRKLCSPDEDVQSKAAYDLGKLCEHHSDLLWLVAVKWGSHEDPDIRGLISACILEHILEYHFDTYFPKCADLIRAGNINFGDTFSKCYTFGQAERPASAREFEALVVEWQKIKDGTTSGCT